MALALFLRRSASAVTPFVSRVVSSGKRSFSSSLVTALNRHANISVHRPCSCPACYSTAVAKKSSSTQSLLRVLDTEVQCAKESDDIDRIEELPKGFPFKIQDNTGETTVTLTREYENESIKVVVHMCDLVTGENDDDDADDNDEDIEKSSQSSVPLVVTISKKSGLSLEFNCVAYPDEVSIDSLSIKQPSNSDDSDDHFAYEGPDFHGLDENMKTAFHKYLEIRGIKPSTTNYLHEYMINKDNREYISWLGNLKKFVEA